MRKNFFKINSTTYQVKVARDTLGCTYLFDISVVTSPSMYRMGEKRYRLTVNANLPVLLILHVGYRWKAIILEVVVGKKVYTKNQ